ncbi:MAG: hypothetical protein M1840_002653 [Geoglossum simile]|nr:MAG: hypothetical protein M1840_002653 [Geoglossum simile]
MDLHPTPSKEALCARFVGKSLHELPMPAAILDVAAVKRNCEQMARAVNNLGCEFPPDVGAHNTTELTHLQTVRDIKNTAEKTLVVSTIADLEGFISVLESYGNGQPTADSQVLYGSQVPLSHVPRLIAVQRKLGPSALSILVDHKDQLLMLQGFLDAELPWPKLFIKIDNGMGDSDGVEAQSNELEELVNAIVVAEKVQSQVLLRGFFCHGLAYGKGGGDYGHQSLNFFHTKINNTIKAARFTRIKTGQANRPFILSVGATPSARGIQNILNGDDAGITSAATSICGILVIAKRECLRVELRNASYPFYDVQQLSLVLAQRFDQSVGRRECG